jgi:hypothetical protein
MLLLIFPDVMLHFQIKVVRGCKHDRRAAASGDRADEKAVKLSALVWRAAASQPGHAGAPAHVLRRRHPLPGWHCQAGVNSLGTPLLVSRFAIRPPSATGSVW